MGAQSYTVTYSFSDKEKVSQAWKSLCENDARESGSGAYAGNSTTMGGHVNFYNKLFSSEEEAYEWVLDNHQKWGDPYACSFYIPKTPGERAEKKSKRAQEKLVQEEKKKVDWMNNEVQTFLGRKSELVSCKCCGSKLSRKHLADVRFTSLGTHLTYVNQFGPGPVYGKLPKCPLCSYSLISDTAQKKYKRLTERVSKAKKDWEESLKPSPSKKVGWVVGGWAAC
jgi:hypothetical protein